MDSDDLWLKAVARRVDMGYTHWLKHYGIVGMTWLFLFYAAIYSHYRRAKRLKIIESADILAFAQYFFVYLVVSFLTLNNLMRTHSILTVCLLCALLVRACREDFWSRNDAGLGIRHRQHAVLRE